MQATRSGWEQRRDLLAGAEKIWIELEARQQRGAQIAAQSAQLRQAIESAEKQLAAAQQENIAILGAFSQAERSLKLAEAACAENVESLRASLEDDTPCPVCGAHEHPYRHNDGPLQAMLGGLQDEVTRCRRQMEANVNQQAAQRATVQASLEQLQVLGTESRGAQQALEKIAAAWSAHALVTAADASQSELPPEPERTDWFTAELEAARTALQAAERQERALLAARNARDQAQSAWDVASAEHTRLQGVASSAQTALALANTEYKALEDQRIEVALTLSALLSDLDAAFSGGDIPSDEWKDDWKTGPARFHAARQAESKQWLAQRAAYDERSAAMSTIDVELKGLNDALAKTGHDALSAREAWNAADAALRAMQEQRMELWGGKQVGEVEQTLVAAIDAARSQLSSRQQAVQQATQTRTRLDEALAQAGHRLTALHASATEAAKKLDDWLAAFQQRQPEDDEHTLRDLEHLHTLLAHSADDIDARRNALQAIDRAADNAVTVLKERQRQREQHQLSAPPTRVQATVKEEDEIPEPPESPVAALASALNDLMAERKAAHDAATALQLALAQDDAKRQQSQAMLAEIEKQEAIEQRWSRMSDLIGSADGKKFRNYAQQFTLDVLLGYANAHLNHLARRYQLERINNPASPSLALLVRDQDMGGEMRSVHSLSGGESFLVSLALALGLASLSSNRVRVESLFIDEGFGSLDAETLRVAMDALDGLQAMGRKVGVISHVQEMTERIATKILVQPSAGGRSTITVM